MQVHCDYIDRIKGFAILLVVMGHLIGMSFYSQPAIALESPILHWIDFFHMPLFAFVSGYLFKTPITYTKVFKKVRILLVPFLFIGMCCAYICKGDGFIDFFLSPYKDGYWYLWAMMIFYMFMPFISLPFVRNVKVRFTTEILLAWGGYLLLDRYICCLLPQQVFNFLSVNMCMSIYLYFAMGMLIRRYNVFSLLWDNRWIAIICIWGYFTLFALKGDKADFLSIGIKGMGIYTYTYIFYRLSVFNSSFLKLLGWFGANSLSIYTFHYFFIHIIHLPILGQYVYNTRLYAIEFLIASILAVFVSAICVCIASLLKKNKVTAFLSTGKLVTE